MGVVSVQEGYQVGFPTVVDVGMAVTAILCPDVMTGVDIPFGDMAIHSITLGSNFFLA